MNDWGLAFIVGLILFFEITFEQSKKKAILPRREIIYRLMFPAATIIILGILPSVKAIFILTSLIFSIILIMLTNLFFFFYKPKKKKKDEAQKAQAQEAEVQDLTKIKLKAK